MWTTSYCHQGMQHVYLNETGLSLRATNSHLWAFINYNQNKYLNRSMLCQLASLALSFPS